MELLDDCELCALGLDRWQTKNLHKRFRIEVSPAHGRHPIPTTRSIGNLVMARDYSGGRKLEESKRDVRINGAVARLAAVHVRSLSEFENDGLSLYEDTSGEIVT